MQNHDQRRYITKVLLLAVLVSVILALSDFYLGALFAEMSIRPFVLFGATYLVSCLSLAFVLSLIRYRIKISQPVFNLIYILLVLLFLDLEFAHFRLLGNASLFAFERILIDLLILTGIFVFTKTTSKSARKMTVFSNFSSLASFAILTLAGTTFFNFLYMNGVSATETLFESLLQTLALASLPYLALVIILMFENLLAKFGTSVATTRALGFVLSTLLVLLLPQITGFPSLSNYYDPGEQTAAAQPSAERPNVILLVMDTARRDQFSLYGYDRDTTPNIEAFAQDAVVFKKAVSAAPWTLPSHASMFTGMYPSRHGAIHSDDELFGIPLAQEHTTLAEILTDAGYKTGAVVSNYGELNKENGVNQGFGFFYGEPSYYHRFFWGMVLNRYFPKLKEDDRLRINKFNLSSEVNEVALNWLDQNRSDNFFLFINYMEAHSGITHLPQPFFDRYDFDWSKEHQVRATLNLKDIIHEKTSVTPGQRQVRLDLVDCKMNYLDQSLGQFFQELKDRNLYDDSIIILTADHGHLYGEHNSFGHNTDLYNPLIMAPLVIKYPESMQRRGENKEWVQSVDLMPEILNLLGLPVPEHIQGQPIDQIDHQVIAEVFRQKNYHLTKMNPGRFYRDLRAIYSKDGNYKYIQASNGDSELYNLSEDPKERNNLITESLDIAKALDDKLQDWRASFSLFPTEQKKNRKLDRKTLERLRSLGYIK